jgi:hypothetical protein
MKNSRYSGNSRSGSVLLFVLVLVAIVSLIFVGWIEIMTARTNLTEVLSYSIQRRVAFQNSRAMFHSYMINVALNNSSGALSSPVMAEGADSSWGSLEVLAWENNSATWQNPGVPPNAFMPVEGSYDPPLQAFFGQSVAISEEGRTESVVRPMIGVVRTRTWANIAVPAQTIAGNVVKLAADAPLWYVSDGSGNITITLASLPFGEIGISDVTNLTLVGDPDSEGFPLTLHMDLQSSPALTTIACSGSNLRPLTIALRQPVAAPRFDWSFGSGQTWISDAVFLDSPVQISNGSSFQGFLLTNSSVLPANLPRRILRPNGWNEIYLSPPSP